MNAAQAISRNTSVQFIEKYVDDNYCLELLRYFGGYPFMRFSEAAVIHPLNGHGGSHRILNALKRLITDGIIRAFDENNLRLYRLTEEDSVRIPIMNLAKIDWSQWQLMIRSTCIMNKKPVAYCSYNVVEY